MARVLSAPSPGKQGWKLSCLAALEAVCIFKSHNNQSQQVSRHEVPSVPSTGGSLEAPTCHLPCQQCPEQFRSEDGASDPCISCLAAPPCGKGRKRSAPPAAHWGRGREQVCGRSLDSDSRPVQPLRQDSAELTCPGVVSAPSSPGSSPGFSSRTCP